MPKNNFCKGEVHMNGYNVKVEIQGIDTAKLPRLSSDEQMEMLKKIKEGKEEYKE